MKKRKNWANGDSDQFTTAPSVAVVVGDDHRSVPSSEPVLLITAHETSQTLLCPPARFALPAGIFIYAVLSAHRAREIAVRWRQARRRARRDAPWGSALRMAGSRPLLHARVLLRAGRSRAVLLQNGQETPRSDIENGHVTSTPRLPAPARSTTIR